MMYLLPRLVVQLVPKLRTELPVGARIVSHDYPLEPWKPDKTLLFEVEEKVAINGMAETKLFYYVVPARAGGRWALEIDAPLGDARPIPLAIEQTPDRIEGTALLDGRSTRCGSCGCAATRSASPCCIAAGCSSSAVAWPATRCRAKSRRTARAGAGPRARCPSSIGDSRPLRPAMSPESPAAARRRYPLHIHLSALFSALVLATGIAIAWLGYGEARDLTLKATDEVFRHVGSETRSALAGALQPVGSFADLLALQPLARARTLDRRLEALPFLRRAFAGHAPIAAAYAGYDDGGFFLVRPLRSDAERAFFEAPAGTAFYAQNIDVGPAGAHRHAPLLRRVAARARPPHRCRRLRPAHAAWYRRRSVRASACSRAVRVLLHPGAGRRWRSARPGSVVGVDVTLLRCRSCSRRCARCRT
jgi:hypothetical protein